MAPRPLSVPVPGPPPCVCNRCGSEQTEDEFMTRVEAFFEGEE
eukprot:CAMPEP_0181251912 /NCGR_PEP_ID=MMETSP1096-20121128/47162_1 /TAXON_ID=156174 ORGANISM="Chrysochromulina ericina, Strain CCMP281" /NCGR_SAMPLE_ID=MMETSP1096 /ASSEMBLY_ACC=CAM_ASM_000453 /LENGTH=42 /DNA_ID= /DNA_START= /DNA_END= /DNA_ORIENTATION=